MRMEIKTIRLHEPYLVKQAITACIGYFDGLHRGHLSLVKEVVRLAEASATVPALITFEPDPWVVLKGMKDPAHLTSMRDRQRIAAHYGIRQFLILDFSKEMADLSVEAFHELLNTVGVATLVCGHDFHYGRFGAGSSLTLAAQSYFAVRVMEPVTHEGVRISSTRVEQLIQEGDVAQAACLLGHFPSISGTVARGYQRGRKLRFPTLNLSMQACYLLPRSGVYAGIVLLGGKRYAAMINVGNNPTFQNRAVSVEAHVFDFDEMVYGHAVRFCFVRFIREECRFDSKEELIWQLKSDQEHIQALFAAHPQWLKEESLCV